MGKNRDDAIKEYRGQCPDCGKIGQSCDDPKTCENFLEECPKCGKVGCECDPETCDCEPSQDTLIKDFEE